MGLFAKDKGGMDIEPVPAGMHHGSCYGVVDIGTQPGFGKFPARRKVIILFELPDVRIELPDKQDTKKKLNLPRAISCTDTLTLASKGNLRPKLESWRGRAFTEQELEGFDLKNVIGANCLINIVHVHKDQKTYANIASINPLAPGMKKRTGELPTLFFSLDDMPKTGDVKFPANMPEWIQGKIMNSDEYLRRIQKGGSSPAPSDEAAHAEPEQEDVPF